MQLPQFWLRDHERQILLYLLNLLKIEWSKIYFTLPSLNSKKCATNTNLT